jgi:glycosyltransferase involved in cell wall biosynthesis
LRLYVIAPSFPPDVGGQEIHLQELSESLIAAGVDVRVIAAAQELPPPGYIDALPVLRVPTYGNIQGGGWRSVPWVGLLLGRVLWRLLRDMRKYDAVLVSGFNILPLAPVFSALLTRKPCVVRPESPLELKQAVGERSLASMGIGANSLLISLLSRLRKAAAARVDRYIAISGEIRARLVAEGIDPVKIVEIPNGINTEKFVPVPAERRAQLRVDLKLPRDARLLVYTGRLAVSKGVMMLMDVWGELAPLYPDAHLLLVGSGAGSADDCESAAREFVRSHGLDARVTFAGSVPNVSEYLQAADIFVFPSHSEGFGLSILEAMSVGLPMVCTRVGVAAGLESEAGIRVLVAPMVRGEFHDALNGMLADSRPAAEVSSRVREVVMGHYSMSIVARQHAAVLAALAGRRS